MTSTALARYTGPFYSDCHACHGTGEDAAFGGTCSECPRRGTVRIPRTSERIEQPAHRPTGNGTGTGTARRQAEPAATDRQLAYLRQITGWFTPIVIERFPADCALATAAVAGETTISKRRASELIDLLGHAHGVVRVERQIEHGARTDNPLPDRLQAAARRPQSPGMFRRSSDGLVFKVQAAKGSGNLYAKQLLPQGGFEYAAGAIRTLTEDDRLTLDQAQAYGRATGVCCVCGTELTDPKSIAAGIGPVCAGRI